MNRVHPSSLQKRSGASGGPSLGSAQSPVPRLVRARRAVPASRRVRSCAQGGPKSRYTIRTSQECGRRPTLGSTRRAWGIVLVAVVVSVGAWFSVGPTRADSDGFQFSVAGDFGSWTGFRETLGILDTSGSDFRLAIGDLSYGGFTGYPPNTTEGGWCAKFHKYFENVAILAGNHDTGDFPPDEGSIN